MGTPSPPDSRPPFGTAEDVHRFLTSSTGASRRPAFPATPFTPADAGGDGRTSPFDMGSMRVSAVRSRQNSPEPPVYRRPLSSAATSSSPINDTVNDILRSFGVVPSPSVRSPLPDDSANHRRPRSLSPERHRRRSRPPRSHSKDALTEWADEKAAPRPVSDRWLVATTDTGSDDSDSPPPHTSSLSPREVKYRNAAARRLTDAREAQVLNTRLASENDALKLRLKAVELDLSRLQIDTAETREAHAVARRKADVLAAENEAMRSRAEALEREAADSRNAVKQLEVAARSTASLAHLEGLLQQTLAEKAELFQQLAEVRAAFQDSLSSRRREVDPHLAAEARRMGYQLDAARLRTFVVVFVNGIRLAHIRAKAEAFRRIRRHAHVSSLRASTEAAASRAKRQADTDRSILEQQFAAEREALSARLEALQRQLDMAKDDAVQREAAAREAAKDAVAAMEARHEAEKREWAVQLQDVAAQAEEHQASILQDADARVEDLKAAHATQMRSMHADMVAASTAAVAEADARGEEDRRHMRAEMLRKVVHRLGASHTLQSAAVYFHAWAAVTQRRHVILGQRLQAHEGAWLERCARRALHHWARKVRGRRILRRCIYQLLRTSTLSSIQRAMHTWRWFTKKDSEQHTSAALAAAMAAAKDSAALAEERAAEVTAARLSHRQATRKAATIRKRIAGYMADAHDRRVLATGFRRWARRAASANQRLNMLEFARNLRSRRVRRWGMAAWRRFVRLRKVGRRVLSRWLARETAAGFHKLVAATREAEREAHRSALHRAVTDSRLAEEATAHARGEAATARDEAAAALAEAAAKADAAHREARRAVEEARSEVEEARRDAEAARQQAASSVESAQKRAEAAAADASRRAEEAEADAKRRAEVAAAEAEQRVREASATFERKSTEVKLAAEVAKAAAEARAEEAVAAAEARVAAAEAAADRKAAAAAAAASAVEQAAEARAAAAAKTAAERAAEAERTFERKATEASMAAEAATAAAEARAQAAVEAAQARAADAEKAAADKADAASAAAAAAAKAAEAQADAAAEAARLRAVAAEEAAGRRVSEATLEAQRVAAEAEAKATQAATEAAARADATAEAARKAAADKIAAAEEAAAAEVAAAQQAAAEEKEAARQQVSAVEAEAEAFKQRASQMAKGLMNRLMFQANAAALTQTFTAWARHVAVAKRARAALQRLMVRQAASNMGAVVAEWAVVARRNRRRRALFARAAAKTRAAALTKCFRAWKDTAGRRKRSATLRRRALLQRTRQCLRAWAGHCRRVAGAKALMRRVLMSTSDYYFSRWVAFLDHRRQVRQRVRTQGMVARMVARSGRQALLRAMLLWRMGLSEKHRQRRIIVKWLKRTVTQRLRWAWTTWNHASHLYQIVEVHSFRTDELERTFSGRLDDLKDERDKEMEQLQRKHTSQMGEMEATMSTAAAEQEAATRTKLLDLEATHQRRMSGIMSKSAADLASMEQAHDKAISELKAHFARRVGELTAQREEGEAACEARLAEMEARMREAGEEAEAARQAIVDEMDANNAARVRELEDARRQALASLEAMYSARLDDSEAKRREALSSLTDDFNARIHSAQNERVASLAAMEEQHRARLKEMEEHHSSVFGDLETSFNAKLDEAGAKLEEEKQAAHSRVAALMEEKDTEVKQLQRSHTEQIMTMTRSASFKLEATRQKAVHRLAAHFGKALVKTVFGAWKETATRSRRVRTVVVRIMAKQSWASTKAVFVAWRGQAGKQRRVRSVVARIMAKQGFLSQAQVFAAWRGAAHRQAHVRELVGRIMGRRGWVTLRGAFDGLRAVTRHQRVVRKRVSRMLLQVGWRTVVRLFRKWKLCVWVLRKRRHMAARLATRRFMRQRRQVLRAWWFLAQHAARKKRIMKRTIVSMLHHQVSTGFYQWKWVTRHTAAAAQRTAAVAAVRDRLQTCRQNLLAALAAGRRRHTLRLMMERWQARMQLASAHRDAHAVILSTQTSTLESVTGFQRVKSVAGMFTAVQRLLGVAFPGCKAVLWVVDFAKDQLWSYTARPNGRGGDTTHFGTPDKSFMLATHGSPASPASFTASPVPHHASRTADFSHPVDTSAGAREFARIKFPLGASLVGACALSREAAAYSSAVSDPRYEPAGDVAVKLALQAHAARLRTSVGRATAMADPDAVPPARAVCVPAFDEEGRVMAVLQLARCGGDTFTLEDMSMLQHVAYGVSVTLHRLSQLAVSVEARREANEALLAAKGELSASAVKLADLSTLAETLTREVEEIRHANKHLGTVVDFTRDQAKTAHEELVTQNSSHQVYIDELEQKVAQGVVVQEQARSSKAAVARLEGVIEQQRQRLDAAADEIEELQLQIRDSIAASVSVDQLEQAHHDKRLLAADVERLEGKLVRVREDCAFLAGAVKEIVAHSGRIGRTRLNEALRVCNRVMPSGDRPPRSSSRREPGNNSSRRDTTASSRRELAATPASFRSSRRSRVRSLSPTAPPSASSTRRLRGSSVGGTPRTPRG